MVNEKNTHLVWAGSWDPVLGLDQAGAHGLDPARANAASPSLISGNEMLVLQLQGAGHKLVIS